MKETHERLWDKWQLEIVQTLETNNEPFQDWELNTNEMVETIYLEAA